MGKDISFKFAIFKTLSKDECLSPTINNLFCCGRLVMTFAFCFIVLCFVFHWLRSIPYWGNERFRQAKYLILVLVYLCLWYLSCGANIFKNFMAQTCQCFHLSLLGFVSVSSLPHARIIKTKTKTKKKLSCFLSPNTLRVVIVLYLSLWSISNLILL